MTYEILLEDRREGFFKRTYNEKEFKNIEELKEGIILISNNKDLEKYLSVANIIIKEKSD